MNENLGTNYGFEGFTLETRSGKLRSPGNAQVALSSRAFSVLLVLIERRGQVLTKAELLDAAWPDVVVEENNLNQAISLIRKALGDSKSASRFIQTIPGRGYRFIAQVAESSEVIEDTPPSSPTPGSARRSVRNGAVSFGRAFMRRRLPGVIAAAMAAAAFILVFSLGWYGSGEAARTAPGIAGSSAAAQALSAETTGTEAVFMEDSIAVLPFSLQNSASGGDLFAFGLHDEIINQLSKIRGLNVLSRNSVVPLAHDHPSIAEIGRRLGVEAVMTGTIMFTATKARVSLQVLEPGSGVILWASTYDTGMGNLAELVSVYSDIALNASKALKVEVTPQEKQALESIPTNSFAAYRYYLAANAAYYALDYSSAWELSKQAITLDPYYYEALYVFASVNTVLIGAPFPDKSSRQHYAMAMETALSMIALAPGRTEGHALKAAVHSTNREWLGVAGEIEKLRELEAPLSDMRFLASVLLCLGDFDGGIEILEANLRAEPVNLYARGSLMLAHELAGNRLQARREYELGEMLTPLWWGDSVEIFLALGRQEPLQDIGEQYGISDELKSLLLAINAGSAGTLEPALLHYRESATKTAVESLFYGAIAAHAGLHELSLELMTLALRDSWLSFKWLWLPVFDQVRELEGFKDLLVESGIPAYWEKYGWPEMCQPEGDTFECKWKAHP